MVNDPHICTRIVTDYRAVAHLVEGGSLLCIVFLQCFVNEPNIGYAIYVIFGIYECIKGLVLLNGILKNNKRNVKIYLALSLITLIITKGLSVFVAIMVFSRFGLMLNMLLILFVIIYFSYEWFMFCHVCRFYKNLNCENVGGVKREEMLVPVCPPEMLNTIMYKN